MSNTDEKEQGGANPVKVAPLPVAANTKDADTAGPTMKSQAVDWEAKFKALEARFESLESRHAQFNALEPWISCFAKAPFPGHPQDPNVKENKQEGVSTENKGEDNGVENGPKKKEKNEKEPPRAIIMINRRDPDSGERKDFDITKDRQEKKAAKGSAFKLVKYISSDEEKDEETEDWGELTIMDEDLKKLLRVVCRKNPIIWHNTPNGRMVLESPFEPLVLNWSILQEEANKDGLGKKDMRARSDLKQLLDIISDSSGDPRLDDYLTHRESFIESKSITFDALWTVFTPGTLVLSRLYLKEAQLFIVMNPIETWPSLPYQGGRRATKFRIQCITYDWAGNEFMRRAFLLEIDYFDGTKPIATLPIRPFTPEDHDYTETRKELIERGKKYVEFCIVPTGNRMFLYEDKAIFDLKGFRSYGSCYSTVANTPSQVKGHVMVDFDSYLKYAFEDPPMGPTDITEDISEVECSCNLCQDVPEVRELWRTDYDGMKGTEEWTDEQYMICPPRVLGYVLGSKQWAQLSVKGLRVFPKLDNDQSAFRTRLHLQGDDTKDLLFGLVNNHANDPDTRKSYELDDIVPEKGKGLVILLYGPPGVGKTSTAQTIALAAGKPLFSVTVADIGTDPSNIEMNFQRIFNLATTWKAVLLIDEADVFLQSRGRASSGASAERNALVSVFLRVLEYYQGILILTTNQIAQFDIAVQSRIHLALRYEELDKLQTINIFTDFLEQYFQKKLIDRHSFEIIKKEATNKLWKEHFDGRQIRNIVTSAMGLSIASNKRSLEWVDVQTVIELTRDFKTDLSFQMKTYLKQERSGGGYN